MRNKLKFHHLLLIGALVLGSCQKEYVKIPPPTPPPVVTTPVNFTTDVYPLITSYNCTDCHNGGQAPDFSSDRARPSPFRSPALRRAAR